MGKKIKFLNNVTIETVAAEGKCVARQDGMVLFVDKTAPGDVVDVKVFRKKKNFAEATPVKYHQYSDQRTEPFCSHYGTCGGCKWQHIDYTSQLSFKRQQVIDQLSRIGHLVFPEVRPTLASGLTRYYRNKLEYTFSDKRWLTGEEIEKSGDLDRRGLGFHIPGRFDKVLDIEHCHLQPEPSNEIRLEVKKIAREKNYSFYDLVANEGFLRNLIIRSANTNEIMVILQVAQPDMDAIRYILDTLIEKFPELTSVNYIINQKKNETYGDQEVINYAGKPFILESMARPDNEGKLLFHVGPKSFFQTNSEQAEQLYKTAWKMAGLKGDELVYDLYTGTGTIACYVAPNARKVIGVEYVEEAIKDARINAAENGLDNLEFYAGDMKDLLSIDFIREKGMPDVIITDPPRAGMHEDVCKALLKAEPEKIVYISCNPATQARDAALLAEKYEIIEVQPVDMFPHTHHVENVILMRRKDNL